MKTEVGTQARRLRFYLFIEVLPFPVIKMLLVKKKQNFNYKICLY